MHYIFAVILFFVVTSGTCPNFSLVTFAQESKMSRCVHLVLSECLILIYLSVTHTRDGSQGPYSLSHSTDSHCQILYVYKSTIPFLVQICLSFWTKTPPRSHAFILLMKEYMPCAPERERTSRCILTAPSSKRNGCWLSLMLLGTPTLFTHSKE